MSREWSRRVGETGGAMSSYYVTDLSHMEGADLDRDAPPEARRLALYLGRIVEAATANAPGETIRTPIPCRRRPGRKPCPGRLLIRRLHVPVEIHWRCPSCEEEGEISGWQGSRWDFTSKDLFPLQQADPPTLEVRVPEAEYRILREHVLTSDVNTDRLVAGARMTSAGVLLRGAPEEVEELLGCVASEVNHTDNRRHRAVLDTLSDRLWDVLSR